MHKAASSLGANNANFSNRINLKLFLGRFLYKFGDSHEGFNFAYFRCLKFFGLIPEVAD